MALSGGCQDPRQVNVAYLRVQPHQHPRNATSLLGTSFPDPNMPTERGAPTQWQHGLCPLQPDLRTMRGNGKEEGKETQLTSHSSSHFFPETAPQGSRHGCRMNPHSQKEDKVITTTSVTKTSKHRTLMQTSSMFAEAAWVIRHSVHLAPMWIGVGKSEGLRVDTQSLLP